MSLLILTLILISGGCKSVPNFTFDNQFLAEDGPPPSLDFASRLDLDLPRLQKFKVLVLGNVKDTGLPPVDPIEEQHIAFQARAALEFRGYQHTEIDEEADFRVALYFHHNLVEHWVPPQVIKVPKIVSATVVGSGGAVTAWGMGSDTAVIPEHRQMMYQPYVCIVGYDKENSKIFHASALGRAQNRTLRFYAPWLMTALRQKIPMSSQWQERLGPCLRADTLGSLLVPATMDGNEYYPTILGKPRSGTISRHTGLKRLDVIVEVNGASTRNATVPQLNSMFARQSADGIHLVVLRKRQQVDLTISPAESGASE